MSQHKTLKAFIWSFLEQGSSRAISLIVQIVLARLLAPEIFGVLAILVVIIEIANVLAISGLGMSLVQETGASSLSYTTAFWLSMGIAVLLYIVIFCLSPIMADFYARPDLVQYLRVLAIVVFFNGFNSIQRSYLTRELKFKSLFKSSFVATLGSGVIGIGMAYAGCGVWALIGQTVSSSIFECLVMLYLVPWKPTFAFSLEEAKRLYSYGWKICATGILGSLYSAISELVIGKVCTVEGLAYYSQGRKWPHAAISIVSNSLQNVLFPAFAALKEDTTAFRNAVRKALSVGQFVIVPLSVMLVVVAEPVIALLLTEKWLPSVFVFQTTCLVNCVLMLQLVNLRAYMALGRSDLYLVLQLFKVVLGSIVICGTAIMTRDVNSVALATCVVSVFNVIVIDLWPAKNVLGLGRFAQLRILAPIVAASFLAATGAFSIGFFHLDYLARLIIQVFVFSLIYLAVARLFRISGLTECKDILSSLKNGRR